MLQINHLIKTYGDKKAVDDLSLHIQPGEIYGFIGHNGAGKTTTIKSCCGILQFDSGEILIDGKSISKDPLGCKSVLAYIPDNPDLYEFMSGIQFLNFVADIFGVSVADRQERIRRYGDMLELTDDAAQVLRQLDTTIQSYDSLMEKLEVDISLVEKEKHKIVEILEDYLKEVHQNLGKIDHNSTITIREKPVKMLRIGLPDWDENENLYQIRLNDMIDEITQKGIEIFERNENAQEYFGTKITTKNLYDTVVGIGNVQIRLYKIEEHREYSITWAEVARNSGGEGFLSAFVILSSLLYYMRRDETDLFADKNEGKVLLMDNPFAQTNASHLLKPLMDMAKKTNTQLICLTGLGGESIYNRFDNIYVLNLIAASLRNGMQYLKGDHLRGNEPETMIVSQIEVMEQQELIF